MFVKNPAVFKKLILIVLKIIVRKHIMGLSQRWKINKWYCWKNGKLKTSNLKTKSKEFYCHNSKYIKWYGN